MFKLGRFDCRKWRKGLPTDKVARKLVESESENPDTHTLLDTRKATRSGVKTNLRQFGQQTTKVAPGQNALRSECSAYFTRCMKRVRRASFRGCKSGCFPPLIPHSPTRQLTTKASKSNRSHVRQELKDNSNPSPTTTWSQFGFEFCSPLTISSLLLDSKV